MASAYQAYKQRRDAQSLEVSYGAPRQGAINVHALTVPQEIFDARRQLARHDTAAVAAQRWPLSSPLDCTVRPGDPLVCPRSSRDAVYSSAGRHFMPARVDLRQSMRSATVNGLTEEEAADVVFCGIALEHTVPGQAAKEIAATVGGTIEIVNRTKFNMNPNERVRIGLPPGPRSMAYGGRDDGAGGGRIQYEITPVRSGSFAGWPAFFDATTGVRDVASARDAAAKEMTEHGWGILVPQIRKAWYVIDNNDRNEVWTNMGRLMEELSDAQKRLHVGFVTSNMGMNAGKTVQILISPGG